MTKPVVETEQAPPPRRGRSRFGDAARAFAHAVVTGNSAVVTVLAIFVALVVGAALIAFSDPVVVSRFSYFFARPSDTFQAVWNSVSQAYLALFEGAVVNPHTIGEALHGGSVAAVFAPLSETVVNAIPLILAGLSFTLPIRAGMINIGAQGQLIAGAVVAGYLGFAIPLPPVLHLIVALLGGIVGGAVWGMVPGLLKARTGAHEVITTIMLNYVALNLIFFLLNTSAMQRPGRTDPISPLVAGSARLPHIAGGSLRIHAGIILALLAAAAVSWLLRRSTVGFEFRAVGSNPDAARTAGMNVGKTYVLAMLLAGALAGLAGANQVLGTEFTLTPGIAGSLGFDAITVALLGRASPLGTVLAGLLFGALGAGGVQMQAATSAPVDVVTVIQSLIVLFIAAPPLIRAIFRLRGAHTGSADQALGKGW